MSSLRPKTPTAVPERAQADPQRIPAPLHPPFEPRPPEYTVPLYDVQLAPLRDALSMEKPVLPSIKMLPRPVYPVPPPPIVPPMQPPPTPSADPLYQCLLPVPPEAPFPSNPPDSELAKQLHRCTMCLNHATTCCRCSLIPLCGSCKVPRGHAVTCKKHSALLELIKIRNDHPARLDVISLLRKAYVKHGYLGPVQLSVWHSMEVLRISGWQGSRGREHDQRVAQVARYLPSDLCRLGEGDVALAFVHNLADPPATEKLRLQSNLNRFSDGLPSKVRKVAKVPLHHLLTLCLIKARVLGSYQARVRDGRRQAFWASHMGRTLSQNAGQRLDDFLVRAGRVDDTKVQKGMFHKYVRIIEERNSVLASLVRGSWKTILPSGDKKLCEEALNVWSDFGDLFLQIPGFPECVM